MKGQVGDRWIAVALGNSRSLWGQFDGDRLQLWQRCASGQHPNWASELDCVLVVAEVGAPERRSPLLASRLAASRTSETQLAQVLMPKQVPLAGQYETLGLDRSLALVGAASRWGWPVLVVDGGTALTVSAADETGRFMGGAIVPGFGLQGAALHDATEALPHIQFIDALDIAKDQPERWATSTEGAIRSGIFYGVLATVREYCRDWRDRYPHSPVAFTGGDGELLHRALAFKNSHVDPVMVLRGIAVCRQTGQASADRGSINEMNA